MTSARWSAVGAAALLLCLATVTSCASANPTESPPQQQADGGNQGVPDGPADPEQDTKIDGVVVSADGPSPGTLSVEWAEAGRSCKGATLVWSPVVNEGVVLIIAGINGSGVDVETGDCGDLPQCLGQQLAADTQLECSMRMPEAGFIEDGTALEMTGSISCTSADVCDEVRERMTGSTKKPTTCSPSSTDDGYGCDSPTDGG